VGSRLINSSNVQMTQTILSQILNKNHIITQTGEMNSKSLLWGIGVIGLALLVATSLSSNNHSVYAANIICAGQAFNTPCVGSTASDNMLGDDNRNFICGANGNDNIVLRGGQDAGYGNEGNDIVNGGEGNDGIFGGGVLATGCMSGGGADRLLGGPGDDVILQDDSGNSLPDGFKDYIDCEILHTG
jgi:Ca2+-binding RTX toxin-like protein